MPGNDLSYIFQKHEQMHGIGEGGDEIEFLIEAPGVLDLRMNSEGTDGGDVGGLKRALQRIL